jgi:hypothetical protein
MKRLTIAVVAVFVIAMAGCALSPEKRNAEKSHTQMAVSATNDRYTVIGYLEKRDRVITIKAGPRCPVYSVATKEGKVLLENLSAEQLKAQAPELHELIKTGVAGDARMRSSKIDASLRLP